jgi:hypothetical protein
MTCNHCHPLCQCGAEEAMARDWAALPAWQSRRDAEPDSRAALLRDAARFPELEAMEAALANYGEAK